LVILISAVITFIWSHFFNGTFTKKINEVKKTTSTFKDIVGLEDCKIALQ